jgi:DNA-binding CsgD family transcriptional regulator
VVLLLTYNVLLSHFLYLVGLRIPGEHILFFLPWFAAVYYCIIRFHFLTMTPEYVSRKLIENIDESVILLDDRKRIVYVNKMIGDREGNDGRRQHEEGRPGSLSDLVVGHRAFEREIDHLLHDEYGTFVCRCTYRSGNEEEIPVHAKVSLVRDSFGDVLGVMIVGKRVKEMRQLKALYRLTSREGELLQYLMAGHAYEEAAGKMGISINTLKRHVSNIYNKLGIETRVELMNLFRDYDLLPPQRADRTVFLFTDREVRP